MHWVSSLFRRQTPLMMATKELRDAELLLLEAATAAEWANSVIAYNTKRIQRLRQFIAQESTT